MSFTLSLSGSLVSVTITGGSEQSPNLASDLADQMMADSNSSISSRAYRSENLIWFDSIELNGQAGSWFKWDDDTRIELRNDFRCLPSAESSSNANDGASIIFGYRTVIAMSVSVKRNDSNVFLVRNGGTAIFLRDSIGVNPLITKANSARNDYPTLSRVVFPARITLEGLSYKKLSGSNSSQKWYFGNSRNAGGLDEVNNLLLSGGGEIFQTYNTTYSNAFIPGFTVAGEVSSSLVTINDSSFGMDGIPSGPFVGTFRGGRYFINDPLFPINPWNGSIGGFFTGTTPACFVVRFSNKITITDGANPISGVNVMIRGSVRSSGPGYDLSLLTDFPQADDISATTTATGVVDNFLIDTLRARNTAGFGNTDGAVESYQYTAQARKYELIAGRYIYQNRNYGVGGLLSSKDDTFIMLTDSALDGISEATAAAYTELDTPQKLYARSKYEWVTNDNFQNDLYVTRSGNQIELTNKTLAIDATASAVFDYSDPQITIKALTYAGGATATTGHVTTLNGALLSGGTFDCDVNYQSGINTTLTNVTVNGVLDFDTAGTYVLDGCTITEVTNSSGGSITLSLTNGATVTTNTGPNITLQQLVNITAPNIIDGSRVQLYNVTKAAELDNSVVSGGGGYSYTANLLSSDVDNGDTLRIRATQTSGATAKAELENTGTITISGLVFLDTQIDQAVYASYGVNGAAVTGITWDSGNMQFDFSDADNQIDGGDIAAWYFYFITTSTGIDEAFGAIDWPQINRIINKTALRAITFDNTKSSPLLINNCWIDRDDGATIIASTSNSIQINPPAVFVSETNTSGLTPSESAILNQIELSVFVDTEAASNGDGTQQSPYDNFDDAKTLADSLGVKTIVVVGDATVNVNLKNFIIKGGSSRARFDLNGQNVDGSTFEGITIVGTASEPPNAKGFRAYNCIIDGVTGLQGEYVNCLIKGTLTPADNAVINIDDCVSGEAGLNRPTISLNALTDVKMAVRKYSGGLTLAGSANANNEITISTVEGKLTLAATNTAGVISIRGVSQLTDNSVGATVDTTGLLETVDVNSKVRLIPATL